MSDPEGKEKDIQLYFDGELSAEDTAGIDPENAKVELKNLQIIRESVQNWYSERSDEVEANYRPGFAARHVLSQVEAEREKPKAFWSIFSPLQAGLAGSVAVLALVVLLSGGSKNELTSNQTIASKSSSKKDIQLSALNPAVDFEEDSAKNIEQKVALASKENRPIPAVSVASPESFIPSGNKVARELPKLEPRPSTIGIGSEGRLRTSLKERPKSVDWIRSSRQYTFVNFPRQKEVPMIWVSSRR